MRLIRRLTLAALTGLLAGASTLGLMRQPADAAGFSISIGDPGPYRYDDWRYQRERERERWYRHERYEQWRREEWRREEWRREHWREEHWHHDHDWR